MGFKDRIEADTFTLIARCEKTGILGVAMCTSSISVGSRCPFGQARTGVGSVQASPDPRLRHLAIRLLNIGYSAPKVVDELIGSDPRIEYRQIGLVDKDGNAAAYTGSKNLPWAGHIIKDGYIAMGNALAGKQTIQAMGNAFEASVGESLEERLMRAVEAGNEAGGQRNKDGSPHAPLFAAAMLTFDWDTFPRVDLRVDHHKNPVQELRRILELYKPLIPYYAKRAADPTIGRVDDWLRKHASEEIYKRYYFKED
jgi:uncharacterized Ntn-hydrolase superfamily protein